MTISDIQNDYEISKLEAQLLLFKYVFLNNNNKKKKKNLLYDFLKTLHGQGECTVSVLVLSENLLNFFERVVN